MGQNEHRSSRTDQEQRKKSASVLSDKETFKHPPHPGSGEPSHRVQEMGESQSGRNEGSNLKPNK